jgi:hypothetical protein
MEGGKVREIFPDVRVEDVLCDIKILVSVMHRSDYLSSVFKLCIHRLIELLMELLVVVMRSLSYNAHAPSVAHSFEQDEINVDAVMPLEAIKRADAAIVASLQSELIEVMTGRGLFLQSPRELTEMLQAVRSARSF